MPAQQLPNPIRPHVLAWWIGFLFPTVVMGIAALLELVNLQIPGYLLYPVYALGLAISTVSILVSNIGIDGKLFRMVGTVVAFIIQFVLIAIALLASGGLAGTQ